MSCLEVRIKTDLKITYFVKPTDKFQKVWIALIKNIFHVSPILHGNMLACFLLSASQDKK